MAMATACRCEVLAALILWFSVAPWLTAGAGELQMAPPTAGQEQECRRRCGEVDIPFPFGYGPSHCMRPQGFLIQCNDTGNGVFKPFLGTTDVEVVNISLTTGQVWVLNKISSYCYNASSGVMLQPSEWSWDLSGTPFTLSDTANKFTVLGCGVLASIVGDSYEAAMSSMGGCIATCQQPNNNLTTTTLRSGYCASSGVAEGQCCQTAIPKGMQSYQVWFDPRNASDPEPFSTCTYAVLADSNSITFSTSYENVTTPSSLKDGQIPMVLDWDVSAYVDTEDCEVARTKPEYACVSDNSRCINTTSGSGGYLCQCAEGFQGNPYLPGGCQDINECNDPTKYGCFGECTNGNGTFTCSCPSGTRGNASIEEGCQKYPFRGRTKIIVGIIASLLLAIFALLATEVFRKKRSNKRQGYFEQHGGKVLSRILKSEGIDFNFFDRGHIMTATSSFSQTNVIGEGAHGTVYRAILTVGDTTTNVAVKRCKKIDKSRTDEFVQELVVLCRVNHPNVIKLLGCCLHFEAPMLVQELVQNGTLNDLLHGKPRRSVTLATRLRIAMEVAEALAYLHSPPHPTLHGDMKPENILLGEGWVVKVSDFGCSTVGDNVQVVPKGTLAYLDPEFLQDLQITEKTDVYSFGVVLMELLTRRKPLTKEQRNLTIRFQESMENGTLGEIIDSDITIEAEGPIAMKVIHQAAELATRCTAVPSRTRPAMRQVTEELRQLSNEIPEYPQALQTLESSGHTTYTANESETTNTGFNTIGNIEALSIELAR